jgi:quercetin dioxygenase-like cupin family protein
MTALGSMLAAPFAALLWVTAAAETADAGQATPVRTILAKGSLTNATGTPLYFKLLRVELEPGRAAPAAETEGMLYVLSTAPLAVTTSGNRTVLASGEALFLPARSGATLEAAENRAIAFLHFLLVPAADLDHARDGAPATITELYRTSAPLAGLGSGALAFDVTRVTFPPHMPPNPPHHRSGDALYFVLSGTGDFTSSGKNLPRPQGTPHYEPSGLVHRWGNSNDSPLVLLVANVTRAGTPAIVSDAPGASR